MKLHYYMLCNFFVFFKHLNNTPFQKKTQNLVVLNTTNPFFTCTRQQISCNLGVSKFLEYICYFLLFNWISACLSKVIPSWPMCTTNKTGKISQKSYLGFYVPF
jgi:hypothetical protein